MAGLARWHRRIAGRRDRRRVGCLADSNPDSRQTRKASPHAGKQLRKRDNHHVGYASYYARKFFGRKMADGTPMRPGIRQCGQPDAAARIKALVTNLKNGRTAMVTIRDRGPFIKGRIIDVSPSTAKLLGILHVGVAKVAVMPLEKLPPKKGSKRSSRRPTQATRNSNCLHREDRGAVGSGRRPRSANFRLLPEPANEFSPCDDANRRLRPARGDLPA